MAAAKSKRTHRPDDWQPLQAYSFGVEKLGPSTPYLLYANMDFNAPRAEDTKKLLEFEQALLYWGGWTQMRILKFLRKHQADFRRFLAWVANRCIVNFGQKNADGDDYYEMWEQVPEVKFLRQHGFEHAGVTIEPYWQDTEFFSGVQLGHKKPRDPLDPIVWDVIAHLSVWGTVFVRCCGYWGCGKFFRPLTKRKRFCSDSCRALAHVPDEDSEEGEAFREERRKYMQRHRVTLKLKEKTPKSKAKRPRRDYLGIGRKLPKLKYQELSWS
jgi:hypothetical protein